MNIVLSGPSGAGKGTITKLLMEKRNFRKFITCTTRKPRENEKNEWDYYFLSNEKFLEYLNNNMIFNVRKYGGNYYGSFEKNIDNIESNYPIVFQLTPDRALEMKKKNPNTLLVLVLPPSVKELNNRRKDRSSKRIEDDIKNLYDARNFDLIIINDKLECSVNKLLVEIDNFENKKFIKNTKLNNEIIDKFIKQFNDINLSSRVENVFNKEIADSWDDKSRFVTYYGIKNPITNEVLLNIHNGMTIADIGCGTGKLISKIDKNVIGSSLIGLDISNDMILNAQKRDFTGNNKTLFINADFLKYDFQNKFDLITFSYVLHHLKNPVEALKRAKGMLTNEGNILFSVPGTNYLKETFEASDLIGRYNIDEMDEIVNEAGLYSLSACRNNFLMTFNSYEMYIKYLKSIGTYQKINDYTNEDWNAEFNNIVKSKFNDSIYITGEYLTYNCKDKSKILRRG